MSAEQTPPNNEPEAAPADNEISTRDAPPGEQGEVEAPAAVEQEEEIPLSVQLEQALTKADEYLDSLQRERAAFQNYRRRVERERLEQHQEITGSVLHKLLPILDDFHRAMQAVPDDQRDEWFNGVALIQRKLERFLADEGVTEMEALGKPFDPSFHEAVGVEAGSGAESGTVIEILQRGYMQGDRVLRPAMVRVAE